jgi:hypothetical protein
MEGRQRQNALCFTRRESLSDSQVVGQGEGLPDAILGLSLAAIVVTLDISGGGHGTRKSIRKS